jgi:hypothetical protein
VKYKTSGYFQYYIKMIFLKISRKFFLNNTYNGMPDIYFSLGSVAEPRLKYVENNTAELRNVSLYRMKVALY